MKPIKLVISAFGSYAGIQEIDFTKLGTAGLYLITGETGSGKTTIFDAVSFALFGKASGEARNNYQMLRSDFAGEKAKTFIELEFVSGEDRYNIKRSIKKTGQEVSLVLPDGTAMSGDRNITPKIIEIIGLDREQFAQIVMIAQNDFLRFLQSNTDERLKILRRIFGTESLSRFQEQLKNLVKRENDNRALILHDFERHGVEVYKRGEKFAEWELQIKSDTSEITDIEKRLLVYDKQKQELAADIAIAEELCKKFTALSSCRKSLTEHKAKAAEVEDAKARAARGEISLYKIKPLYDSLQKETANHSAAQAGLITAQQESAAAEVEAAAAVKTIEALPPLADAQLAYTALVKKHETAAQNLEQLSALKTRRKEISVRQTVLSKTKEELTAVQKILNELPLVSDCRAEFDNLTAELKNSEERLAVFLSLQKDFKIIIHKQSELEKQQSEFEILNSGFSDADKKYRLLEETFLKNQAGIIAKTLTDGEPCPVCGSSEHPLPAVLSGGDISEPELKKAKEKKDKAGAEREAKAAVCGALQTEKQTLAARFIADVSPLIPDVTIETAEAPLQKSIIKLQAKIQEDNAKKATAEKSLAELNIRFNKYTEKHNELTPLTASLKGEVDTLLTQFINDFSGYMQNAEWESSGPKLDELHSEAQAEADNLSLKKDADKKALDLLAANWDAAVKRQSAAQSAATAAAALVGERALNEQKLLKLLVSAQSNYENILSSCNFFDTAEYKAAIITENELAALKNHISDHEKNGEQLMRDVSRLENETANKELPDILSLQKDLETADTESKLLSGKRDEITGRLSKTETANKELLRAAVLFEKSEKAYAAVKQLSDAANGKLDFETYAQTAYFERVLRAANLRLKIMSQNRYTILRKTDIGDGRRSFGLEMEVMDSYTGKARSANSLSGGESFMASLSLALGLSDIVRQSAGGLRLDAMFIDEGFGTLDADVLELAVKTLSEMAASNRTIGIISHVAELREWIDKQIQIEKTPAGSKIYLSV
ncbi:MAG: SMC family ATPase [Oscillospiraceae bacterium]|nr:SMC family ATPase [Oscillospiraceae bacterium]